MPNRRPIAAAAVFLCAAAVAAENVPLDNVSVTLGPTTWRAAHADVTGSSLPQAELANLFSGAAAAIDARLEKFSAGRVAIPSLTSETRAGTDVERSTYRDSALENIAAGRVGVWRSAGGETTVEPASGAASHYVWGPTQSKGLDLRQAARIALGIHAAGEPLKPLIEEEVVDSARLEDAQEGLVVTTGRLALAGVKGRPLSFAWPTLFERLEKLDPEKDDPALLRDFIEVLSSFEAASLEANAIAGTGKGEPLGKQFSFKLGRLAAKKLADVGVGEASVDNAALTASDGGVLNIGRFALRDLALAPALKNDAWPRLSHLELKDAAGDLPDPKTSEKSRVKFALAGAQADFGNFIETLPSKFSTRFDHAIIDLAARGETESTAQFLALGYKSLDLSGAAQGEWREAAKEATIGPIAIEGAGMGAARLTLSLSNVTSAVFSSMPIVAKAAALAMSVTSLDLTLEGGELVDRMLALEAKERKIAPDKARAEYAKAVSEAVTAMTGGGEKAKQIGAAFADYVMHPKKLHVRLSSPKGVNALEALAKKPGDLVESAEVEAVAER